MTAAEKKRMAELETEVARLAFALSAAQARLAALEAGTVTVKKSTYPVYPTYAPHSPNVCQQQGAPSLVTPLKVYS